MELGDVSAIRGDGELGSAFDVGGGCFGVHTDHTGGMSCTFHRSLEIVVHLRQGHAELPKLGDVRRRDEYETVVALMTVVVVVRVHGILQSLALSHSGVRTEDAPGLAALQRNRVALRRRQASRNCGPACEWRNMCAVLALSCPEATVRQRVG
ncbi:MAG: hypothetical protein WKG01_00940 [Kofleriaceae bacterium]